MKKICIIIPYFGKWPEWFDLFLETCKYNPTINWFFFTDCGEPVNKIINVKYFKMTLEEFNTLATNKLKIQINIKHPYKLCDFKPAYGVVFEDYLINYDFWGYGDIDLLYGNIRKFITVQVLETYDIITGTEKYLAGHLSLFRNSDKINRLYEKCSNYKMIFKNQKFFNIDEKIIHSGKTIIPSKIRVVYNKFKSFIKSGIKIIISPDKIIRAKQIKEKWNSFLNKMPVCQNIVTGRQKTNNKDKLYDMTEVVKYFSKNNIIKSYSKNIIKTDAMLLKEKKDNWKFYWKNGKLTDYENNKELLYFHFYYTKQEKTFIIPQWEKSPESFYISKEGILLC